MARYLRTSTGIIAGRRVTIEEWVHDWIISDELIQDDLQSQQEAGMTPHSVGSTRRTRSDKSKTRKQSSKTKRSTRAPRRGLGRGLKDGLAPVPASDKDLVQAAEHGNERAQGQLVQVGQSDGLVGTTAPDTPESRELRDFHNVISTRGAAFPFVGRMQGLIEVHIQDVVSLTQEYVHHIRGALSNGK